MEPVIIYLAPPASECPPAGRGFYVLAGRTVRAGPYPTEREALAVLRSIARAEGWR